MNDGQQNPGQERAAESQSEAKLEVTVLAKSLVLFVSPRLSTPLWPAPGQNQRQVAPGRKNGKPGTIEEGW